jgi:hypothetical protein
MFVCYMLHHFWLTPNPMLVTCSIAPCFGGQLVPVGRHCIDWIRVLPPWSLGCREQIRAHPNHAAPACHPSGRASPSRATTRQRRQCIECCLSTRERSRVQRVVRRPMGLCTQRLRLVRDGGCVSGCSCRRALHVGIASRPSFFDQLLRRVVVPFANVFECLLGVDDLRHHRHHVLLGF